jgi:Uma2 family endonuclease
MATPVLIPVSEYLNTTYHPDCDYVNGELKERNVGEKPHSALQMILSTIFMNNRRLWGLIPLTEQRVQTSPTNFRIPDVCAIRPIRGEFIVQTPPVVCIEVLSKGDSLAGLQEKLDDYLRMGVENIWILEPLEKIAYRVTANGPERVMQELTIEGTPVRIDLNGLFRELDELLDGRL